MRLSAVSISKSLGASRQAVDKTIKRGRIDTRVSETVIMSTTPML
jgi:IS30 family transposase